MSLSSFESANLGKQSERFVEFLRGLEVTASQAWEAYELLLGTADKPATDRTVIALAEKMQKLERGGIPVSEFARIIERLRDEEASLNGFKTYLEASALSENEKHMLWSIPTKRRCGILECFVDGTSIGVISVEKTGAESHMAHELFGAIKSVMSRIKEMYGEEGLKSVTFSFEAKE
ncbi:hypothetical protein KC727_00835 [Candidatus Kaiserbacteria bacterium]|nr:hypothetical protein [Candidatus Kaiserbacteria bacterium]